VVVSTALVLLLALPAAYALSIAPVRGWKDALFFFISTKMLPVAGSIVALYVIAKNLGLLDHLLVLIILYTAMNLPIAVWMMRSFFLEVPGELLEAAEMDGAPLRRTVTEVILPVVAPGLAATALICSIFAWNEFFFAVNLTATQAATVPVFLVGFISSEGLYFAQLCAAATVATLPVILAGWIAQRQLVRGAGEERHARSHALVAGERLEDEVVARGIRETEILEPFRGPAAQVVDHVQLHGTPVQGRRGLAGCQVSLHGVEFYMAAASRPTMQ